MFVINLTSNILHISSIIVSSYWPHSSNLPNLIILSIYFSEQRKGTKPSAGGNKDLLKKQGELSKKYFYLCPA